MNITVKTILFTVAVLAAAPAKSIDAFACEPEWKALLDEIGAGHVETFPAITAQQDPHYIQARPSLISRVRDADLLVCTGAQLEIGWLPLLLRRATNASIQPGEAGYFLAASQVRKLEVPAQLDRAQGDIHPEGNPHVHLDPRNIERIAEKLSERLRQIDPANAGDYGNALDDFLERWEEAVDGWEERGEKLEDMRLVTHHRSFSYLMNWLDIDYAGTLEPKPGVPPTSGHLSGLLGKLEGNPPAGIARTPYTDPRASQWLSERLGAPEFELPYTVGGAEGADDLFGLYEVTLERLEEAAP